MKHARYLGLLAKNGSLPRERREHALTLCSELPDLALILDEPRLLLLADRRAEMIIPDGNRGAVIGTWRDRLTGLELRARDRTRQAHIIASGATTLVEQGWGHYVAFGCGQDATWILRAPLGQLPCLICDDRDIVLVASDLDLLARGGWEPKGIAWDRVADHLVARDIAGNQSCLVGVAELRGGDRMLVGDAGHRIERCWSPWDHVVAPDCGPDTSDAGEQLRDTLIEAVQTAAGSARHPMLMLSGGLDSSIVAACLASHRQDFTCFNLVSDDPSGDERLYARSVARHLGVKLVEAVRQVANVDVTRSDAANMPRPVARSFVQDSNCLAREAAESVGADLIVDGGGGDNVFCSLQSAAPVADAMLSRCSPAQIWGIAHDIARIAEAGMPVVLMRGVQRAWRRAPGYRWPLDTSFLTRDVTAEAVRAAQHPWLAAPQAALPGKAAHVALIVAAQNWVESLDPGDIPPATSPLVSQPVVEACLRIPSWHWFRDGRNRSVVRDPFADCLPREVIGRQSKASPDSFVAALFEQNRATLRGMLIDGVLARNGLVDVAALDRILCDPRPAFGQHYRRIMRLADVEAWARNWA